MSVMLITSSAFISPSSKHGGGAPPENRNAIRYVISETLIKSPASPSTLPRMPMQHCELLRPEAERQVGIMRSAVRRMLELVYGEQ
jgi:hypothetical protein